MQKLGIPKISGCFPVTSAEKMTVLARIPRDACKPASLCVRNLDTAAIIYIKTLIKNNGGKVSSTDAGIVLYPRDSYDWNGNPPRNCDVVAISSVDAAAVSVDGNWCVPGDDED